MEILISRLEDPDPSSGNRMIPAAAWKDRPDTMKGEYAFLKDNKQAKVWHVITSVKECENGSGVHLVFEDPKREEIHVSKNKMIYITEDQHERLIDFHRRKIEADTKMADIPPEMKDIALGIVRQMSDLNNALADQLELEVMDGELRDIDASAWGVIDKYGRRVDWLPLLETDPEKLEKPDYQIALANKANPDGAPHRYRVYFA